MLFQGQTNIVKIPSANSRGRLGVGGVVAATLPLRFEPGSVGDGAWDAQGQSQEKTSAARGCVSAVQPGD